MGCCSSTRIQGLANSGSVAEEVDETWIQLNRSRQGLISRTLFHQKLFEVLIVGDPQGSRVRRKDLVQLRKRKVGRVGRAAEWIKLRQGSELRTESPSRSIQRTLRTSIDVRLSVMKRGFEQSSRHKL